MNKLQTKIKKMKNKKGFTLIELIVVIVILGILAAIAIPRLSGFSEKAQIKACTATRHTMETAAAAIYAETGSYPADAAALGANATYFAKAPECPTGGDYTLNANGTVTCSVAAHN